MNKECKHEWHLIREFFIDELSNLVWRKNFPSGNYCKFICSKCGKIKYVKETE